MDEEIKRLRQALIIAWVLLGRCDTALGELEETRRIEDRRGIINRMRLQIMNAMASSE